MSSTSENKRNIMYALGAGAALLGAVAIYFLTKDASQDPKQIVLDKEEISKLLKALKLGDVQKDQMGRLDTNYFLKVLQFIGAQTRVVLKDYRASQVKLRRDCYKKKEWEAYRKIVVDVLNIEDEFATKILDIVLSDLEIADTTFASRHEELSRDPQYGQFVMAAQQGKLDG